MRNINAALNEHRKKVLSEYAESDLLGVFLFGSQNYHVETENSDVNTIAIIIPTVQDMCLNDKPLSRDLELPNNEHCVVKDIRLIVDMFSKQNTNFLEILFTEYKWINPKFEELWTKYFVNNRERIAHMNPRRMIKSMIGQSLNSYDRSSKGFATAIRLTAMFGAYIGGVSYAECLNMKNYSNEIYNSIMSYKAGRTPTEKELCEMNSKLTTWLDVAEAMSKIPDPVPARIMEDGLLALVTNEHQNFDFYKLQRKNYDET